MAVLPQLDPPKFSPFTRRALGQTDSTSDVTQKNELWNRVMQSENPQNTPPNQSFPSPPPWYRKTFPFPVIVNGRGVGWAKIPLLVPIIITPITIIVFIISFINNGQLPLSTSTTTNATPNTPSTADTLTQKVSNFFSLTDISTQDLTRQPTTSTTNKFQYLNFTAEVNSGLTPNGKLLEGYATQTGNSNYLPNPDESDYRLQARDLNGQILSTAPLWFPTAEGDQTTGSGLAHGTLALPIATNHVTLINSDDQLLDQVYVPTWKMQLNLNQIPSYLSSNQVLTINGQVTPSDQSYFTDILLYEVSTQKTIILGQSEFTANGTLTYNFDLSNYDIPRTSDWLIEVTTRSFFEYQSAVSNRFTITVQ